MSAASLLKVYDGQDPELAFLSASGSVPNLTQVLTKGADAGAIAITNAGNYTGNTAADLEIESGATKGLILACAVGASLTATTGGCKVESTAGVLELNADSGAGELNIVLDGAKLTAFTLSGSTGLESTTFLKLKLNGTTDIWVPYFITDPSL